MRKPPSQDQRAVLISLGIPPHFTNVNRAVLAEAVAGMDDAAKRVAVFRLRQARLISAVVAMEAAGVVA
jgi:hypothetical protein